ncbi:MAG TPA: basic secretory protein-like protein [Armatimonadota bacterium]|jgi:hypothetical protein
MTRKALLCLLTTTVAAFALQAGSAFAQSETKPSSKKVAVTIDCSQAPELQSWADAAKATVEKWYPKLDKQFKTKGFAPPRNIKLIFRPMNGVAYTDGTGINISQKWVTDHPDDMGMVVHEMFHVIQSYPSYNPVWLVEGITDYVRFFIYEPKAKLGFINPDKAKYTDSYRTTGAFLNWITKNYDKKFVTKVNTELRHDTFSMDQFKQLTGKSVDELWDGFIAYLRVNPTK